MIPPRIDAEVQAEGDERIYIYGPGGMLLGEYDQTTPVVEYVPLDGAPLAQIHGPDGADETYFVHASHVGQPERLTDSQRAVVWHSETTPFGEPYNEGPQPPPPGGPVTQSTQFPGQYADSATSISYNWHRYYDPSLGRYISADPIGQAGGVNVYSYAYNSPTNFTDPTGLLVDASFDVGTGRFSVTDRDTGATATMTAESGGKPFGDPVPTGPYDILDHPNPDFFRLEPDDTPYGDDTHNVSDRDLFRLHLPGRTIGCISAENKKEWDKVRDLISNTATTESEVESKSRNPFASSTERIKNFGTLTVTNSKAK